MDLIQLLEEQWEAPRNGRRHKRSSHGKALQGRASNVGETDRQVGQTAGGTLSSGESDDDSLVEGVSDSEEVGSLVGLSVSHHLSGSGIAERFGQGDTGTFHGDHGSQSQDRGISQEETSMFHVASNNSVEFSSFSTVNANDDASSENSQAFVGRNPGRAPPTHGQQFPLCFLDCPSIEKLAAYISRSYWLLAVLPLLPCLLTAALLLFWPIFILWALVHLARRVADLAWHWLQAARSLLPPASITMSPISSPSTSAVQFLRLPELHRRLAWSEFGADCAAASHTILTFLPPPMTASSKILLTGREDDLREGNIRLVAFDLPGTGLSDPLPPPHPTLLTPSQSSPLTQSPLHVASPSSRVVSPSHFTTTATMSPSAATSSASSPSAAPKPTFRDASFCDTVAADVAVLVNSAGMDTEGGLWLLAFGQTLPLVRAIAASLLAKRAANVAGVMWFPGTDITHDLAASIVSSISSSSPSQQQHPSGGPLQQSVSASSQQLQPPLVHREEQSQQCSNQEKGVVGMVVGFGTVAKLLRPHLSSSMYRASAAFQSWSTWFGRFFLSLVQFTSFALPPSLSFSLHQHVVLPAMSFLANVITSISWLLGTLAAVLSPSRFSTWIPGCWRQAVGEMAERVLPDHRRAVAGAVVEGVVGMLQQGDLRATVEVMLLTWLSFEEAGEQSSEGYHKQSSSSCQKHLELLLELQSGPVHIWQPLSSPPSLSGAPRPCERIRFNCVRQKGSSGNLLSDSQIQQLVDIISSAGG